MPDSDSGERERRAGCEQKRGALFGRANGLAAEMADAVARRCGALLDDAKKLKDKERRGKLVEECVSRQRARSACARALGPG